MAKPKEKNPRFNMFTISFIFYQTSLPNSAIGCVTVAHVVANKMYMRALKDCSGLIFSPTKIINSRQTFRETFLLADIIFK